MKNKSGTPEQDKPKKQYVRSELTGELMEVKPHAANEPFRKQINNEFGDLK